MTEQASSTPQRLRLHPGDGDGAAWQSAVRRRQRLRALAFRRRLLKIALAANLFLIGVLVSPAGLALSSQSVAPRIVLGTLAALLGLTAVLFIVWRVD